MLAENTNQVASLLEVMSNPKRLMILRSLLDEGMFVYELNSCVPLSISVLCCIA